jgi:hypothetical protein
LHFPSNNKYGISVVMPSPFVFCICPLAVERIGNAVTTVAETADATNFLRENPLIFAIIPPVQSQRHRSEKAFPCSTPSSEMCRVTFET